MIKEATNSNYGVKYGAAFNSFFSKPHWTHFTSTDGDEVVEFTEECYYDNAPADIKIQFVLDISGGTFTAEYLSINDVSQNKFMLAAMIKKVFESY